MLVVKLYLTCVDKHGAQAQPFERMFDLVSLDGCLFRNYLLKKRTKRRYAPLAVAQIVKFSAADILKFNFKRIVKSAACDNDAQVFVKNDYRLPRGGGNLTCKFGGLFLFPCLYVFIVF